MSDNYEKWSEATDYEPCTDAREQGHGCLRAVKAENELATLKEQMRVLEDETLALGDERNAAVRDAKRKEWLYKLFDKKWNSVVGSGSKCYYELRGDWRHIVRSLDGKTLDTAIDAAMKECGK